MRTLLIVIAVLLLTCQVDNVFAHGASKSVFEDVRKHRGCSYCGMDRGQYAHSRVVISYADGSVTGLCSVRCLVIEMKISIRKQVRSIEVADFKTKQMIDAEKAFWVVGGKVRGVMTEAPKWAFAEKENAESFIRQHGGALYSFQKVLSIAEKEK
jgi:copper chaperone NosL